VLEQYINGSFTLLARREIIDIAIRYYSECEAFDRQHCSGISPRTGHAVPVDSHELGVINRHALALKRELEALAMDLGASKEEWMEALSMASRVSPC